MKDEMTVKKLEAMTPEKRMYWLRKLSSTRIKKWQIPYLSLGGQQMHVHIMRGLPLRYRNLYAEMVS